MARWGMVIDLRRCIGCWACTIACKEEHFLPRGILWNRVLISESGRFPTVTKEMYPVLCNHCEEAACVEVCPSGASIKREDGVVLIDSDKCVGCRYCVVACPYQHRTFYDDVQSEYFPRQGLTAFEKLGREIYPLEKGTAVKCNFCVERIDEGLGRGLKPGVDRDATPACVNICPVAARVFGDLEDSNSNVSDLIRGRRGVQFHTEFGTDPSVYYVR
ncbi:MAG: 4Fe-4S dicluster domain-containing protein [Thermodesulfobacteriota bacterium]|nr:4Fe-4S dicluster domain-containing protein [Thermodesulfobacteriota bacterium]